MVFWPSSVTFWPNRLVSLRYVHRGCGEPIFFRDGAPFMPGQYVNCLDCTWPGGERIVEGESLGGCPKCGKRLQFRSSDLVVAE